MTKKNDEKKVSRTLQVDGRDGGDWFNRGLLLNVEIHGLDCEAYDADDAAKNWNYADFVRCVNCHKYGYVELGIDNCPACKCTGCLMDIQESDIKERDDG